MARRIDYRKKLLRIIDLLLEGTPTSIESALKQLHAFPHPMDYTVESLLWGPSLTMLTDSAFNRYQEFLHQLQDHLLGRSGRIQRLYIHRDFRPIMTADESTWHARLENLLVFIFAVIATDRDDADAAAVSYESQVSNINAVVARLPTSERLNDELIHRLILHDVTAILTNIDIGMTLLRRLYPIPAGTYSSLTQYTQPRIADDASTSLTWADIALQAISGKKSLLVTWQFRRDVLVFSLH